MVQLVVLLGGFLVAVPFVLSSVGGMDAITPAAGAVPAAWDFFHSSGPGSGWALLFLLMPNFIISPGLVQKAYGAVDARAVRIGIGVQAFALMIFSFGPVLLGMAAQVAHPGIESRDLVLPTLMHEHLPPLFGALALAAIFSAEVSTCDAILFMLSTSLSQDLYKRFLRPQATDRQLLRVARLAAAAGGTAGVFLALLLPTVIAALSIFYSLLAVSLFVPVVGGLYTRRANSAAALSAIAAGVSTRLALQFVNEGRGFGLLDPTLLGLLAAAAAFLVVVATGTQQSTIKNQE